MHSTMFSGVSFRRIGYIGYSIQYLPVLRKYSEIVYSVPQSKTKTANERRHILIRILGHAVLRAHVRPPLSTLGTAPARSQLITTRNPSLPPIPIQGTDAESR